MRKESGYRAVHRREILKRRRNKLQKLKKTPQQESRRHITTPKKVAFHTNLYFNTAVSTNYVIKIKVRYVSVISTTKTLICTGMMRQR